MDNLEISQALQDLSSFGGARPADILPRDGHYKFYVLNTDTSDRRGKHWVAVYLNPYQPEFFDSLGHSPVFYHKEFEYLLINHSPNQPNYLYNSKRLQQFGSNVCGLYCIYYIVLRDRGYSMHDIVNTFTGRLDVNDELVKNFYNQL